MSRGSSSAPPQGWPKHGPVLLTRFPECPRVEPLVCLTCKKVDTGNYGREFVKCESRPQPRKILKQCTYFSWLDAYVEKLQFKGMDLTGGAVSKLNFSPDDVGAEQQGRPSNAAANVVAAELKKLNSNVRNLVKLKQQEIMICGAFYVCVVFLFLLLIVVLFKGLSK